MSKKEKFYKYKAFYIVSDFVNNLIKAKEEKVKSIVVRPTTINKYLLKFFDNLGIINGYYPAKKLHLIEVFIKYYNEENDLDFNALSLPSERFEFDFEGLEFLKDTYPNYTYLLATAEGLMLDVDCLDLKIGGVILLKISYVKIKKNFEI